MSRTSILDNLTNADELSLQLSTTGLSFDACDSRAAMFGRVASALSVAVEADSREPPLAFFVPGRIEVLGKHTDYAGGRTMIAAAERGFCVAALPRKDREIVVINAANGETVVFLADPELKPQSGAWSNYPITVARRIARNFPGATRGADIAILSDLPPAAGMGSSSALMAAVFLVLADINRLDARDDYWHNIGNKTDLAGYLSTIENGQGFGTLAGDSGVGTRGGSEDQTAILCAEANCISQYAYCPVEFEKIFPVPPGYVFAIAVSGVAAEKTGAAMEQYNAAARLVAMLLELWRGETGRDDANLAAALDSSPDAVDRLKALIAASDATNCAGTATGSLTGCDGGCSPMPEATAQLSSRLSDAGRFDADALAARLEHFMIESGEIIPEAGGALAAGDLAAFGELVDRSQKAAERLLRNQVSETVFLASAARRLGASAASAFGGGFGGSVWALVEASIANEFLAAWSARYREKFPHRAPSALFFATAAGPAAFRVC